MCFAACLNDPTNPICNGDVIDLHGTPTGGTYSGNTINGSSFSASAGAGTYSVTYTYSDANSCSSKVEAILVVEECSGIANLGYANAAILIYRSPVKDNLIIKSNYDHSKIIITDALGRVMLVKNVISSEEKINIETLLNGIYVVRILDDSNKTIKTSKILKN